MFNKWADRSFDFDYDFSLYPKFISRLNETPTILKSLITNIPERIFKIKHENEWTIQENVGHLISVDYLFVARLDEYEAGEDRLSPADMSGSSTSKENYNSDEMQNLLEKFAKNRNNYVLRLQNVDSALFNRSAWHPRLEKQMRLSDMLFFQAEHDDHHLNKIKYLQLSTSKYT